MREENYKYEIGSIGRTFKIIELLAERSTETSAVDIASELNLPKGTLHRFLKTIEALGYVEQNPNNKKYYLSGKFLDIAHAIILLNGTFDSLLAYMKLFVNKFGFDVSLLKFSNDEVYLLYSITASLFSINTRHFLPGKIEPLHALASGKLLLSTYMDSELETKLENATLIPSTAKTITDKEILKQEIFKTRQQSYGIANGEFEEGVVSLAIPIKAYTGDIIGAMAFRTNLDKADLLFSSSTIEEILKTVGNMRVRL